MALLRGNTQILADSITNSEINSAAAIAYSKLNLTGSIVNADLNTAAAIDVTKLEVLADGEFIIGDGTDNNKATISGDIGINNTGLASISAGVIVNADVNANAAIDVTKLEVLADAAFIIGDGTDNNKNVISGDISIGNTGLAAISAGVIINADVNTGAAIAESKLAFDTSGGHNHDGTNSRLVSAAAVGGFDITRETLGGTINGTNTAFTLANTPTSNSEIIFLNGVMLQAIATATNMSQYEISGTDVTMGAAPEAGDLLSACYGTD